MSKVKGLYSDEEINTAIASSSSKKEAREKLNALGRKKISRQAFDYWLAKAGKTVGESRSLAKEHADVLRARAIAAMKDEYEQVRKLASGSFENILVIPDLHCPYQHQDALKFLEYVADEYKPDLILCTGDELDNHAISFHDTDPDLLSAGDELQRAREWLRLLNARFPEMYLVRSNHTSLNYRRAKRHGLPKHLLLSYRDLIFGDRAEDDSVIRRDGLGDGWHWADHIIVRCSDGSFFKLKHGDRGNRDAITEINSSRMSVVRGHYHSTFNINYSASDIDLLYCMTLGWLGDDQSLAFSYNRTINQRPIAGCGLIRNGQPLLIPMVIENGRWIGELR